MNKLKSLDLTSASLVRKYQAAYPPKVSEQTFTNLFVWHKTRPVWFYEDSDTIVFLTNVPPCKKDELLIFGPPLGKSPLTEVLDRADRRILGAVRVTAEEARALPPRKFIVTRDRNNDDYVYRVQDLVSLAGRRYAKKRSHVKQCLKNHTCTFEKITGSNLDECRQLMDRWCQTRECALNPGLNGESQAIEETLKHFEKLELSGGAVRIEGVIQAFSLAEKLSPDTAVWHFEKAMPDFQGLGQLINQWFAKECLAGFKFVNREQDLGIPGLRQAKESYFPDHMVEKFTVFRN